MYFSLYITGKAGIFRYIYIYYWEGRTYMYIILYIYQICSFFTFRIISILIKKSKVQNRRKDGKGGCNNYRNQAENTQNINEKK